MKRLLYILLIALLFSEIHAQQITPTTAIQSPAAIRTPAAVPSPYSGASKINFVRTWDAKAPVTDEAILTAKTVQDVQQSTGYMDGLGRPLQTVARQVSPLQKDMVSPIVYDPIGRGLLKYLPYADTGSFGLLKLNPFADQQTYYTTPSRNNNQYIGELFFYGETQVEPSPLNRPSLSMAPGNSWSGSNRGIQRQYEVNDVTDAVRVWTFNQITDIIPVSNATYAAGLLTKTIAIDEQGKKVVEYRDKENNLILKKTQSADVPGVDHSGWLCTYYVYDAFNLLRFVIQPKAVESLPAAAWAISTDIANGLCFQYRYDDRHRLISKKLPGADEIQMIYDNRDRLVMSQDGNMRSIDRAYSQDYWSVTVYDNQNRPIKTGILSEYINLYDRAYFASQAATGATVPNLSALPLGSSFITYTENYYDDYSWFQTGLGVQSSRINTWDGKFQATSSTTWPYPEP